MAAVAKRHAVIQMKLVEILRVGLKLLCFLQNFIHRGFPLAPGTRHSRGGFGSNFGSNNDNTVLERALPKTFKALDVMLARKNVRLPEGTQISVIVALFMSEPL